MRTTSLGMHEIERVAKCHTIIDLSGGGIAILDGEGTERARHPRLTLAIAKQVCSTWGLTLRKDEADEYRVNKIGGREATAAYTGDLRDAVNTGIAMARKGVW